tara:strand:- start:25 stop:213 length:189 start_codon:yes stop_codon:yes gene_type:complete
VTEISGSSSQAAANQGADRQKYFREEAKELAEKTSMDTKKLGVAISMVVLCLALFVHYHMYV